MLYIGNIYMKTKVIGNPASSYTLVNNYSKKNIEAVRSNIGTTKMVKDLIEQNAILYKIDDNNYLHLRTRTIITTDSSKQYYVDIDTIEKYNDNQVKVKVIK